MEFLASDNIAGQSLLQLTARGSAIICELLRLSNHIPSVFLGSAAAGADPADVARYSGILFDFRYFKSASAFESKIDDDGEAGIAEEEFFTNHHDLLKRFYTLFESIYKYVDNLTSYLADMEKGSFLQHTIEGVLQDSDGRQLLCEALYLYGCMLLLLDMRIPGPARERMIVAHYRYRGEAALPNVKMVQKLCADTGFTAAGKRPANYPDEYFRRIPLPREVIDMVLGKLRTDDIYNHSSSYPLPAHRSTALANQAAMLYVCLYFAPDILHSSNAVCREVIDKFFVDNWVITMHMGFAVDLTEAWDPYKAAKTALKAALTREVIDGAIAHHATAVPQLAKELDHLLTQGVLTEDRVMDSHRALMHTVRCCNITLRWLILHRTSGHPKVREAVRARVSTQDVLTLLLHTAQLEFLLKSTVRGLLDTKQQRFEALRQQAAELVVELSEVYGGIKALSRVKKSENLKNWFAQIAHEITSIHYGNSVVAGRTLTQLVQALEDVQDFHQVEASLQVKQCIGEVKGFLTGMIRLANITPKLVSDLDIVADFSYAKKAIVAYTPLMHELVARDPSVCLLLRATFLKLSSILSIPLVRIIQAGSQDDVSVAEFYSTELVGYVRSVLDIVPRSVFRILDGISTITADRLKPLPPKLERKFIKEASQLQERYALAKLTNNVSVFTRGILNMHTTLLGIIKLDPQQTLEDGIRKQLVQQIASAMDSQLVFASGKVEDFEARIEALGRRLGGIRTSLEYIQDYINVYGLKIWQEEVSRIVNYNVEQECNQFLKHKVYDWQSQYQSEAIPVPVFERAKDSAQRVFVNFMGRLVNELVRQTSPATTTYSVHRQGWFRVSDGREAVGVRTFALLRHGLGISGLCGVDKLLSFMIVRDLTAFCKLYRKIVANKAVTTFVYKLGHELAPTSQFPAAGPKLYLAALQKTEKVWQPLLDLLVHVGQYQLLRRHIRRVLSSAKMDSSVLYSITSTLNEALLNDLRAHYEAPDERAYPENPLMPALGKYLETMGLSDPVAKIYITTEGLPAAPLMIFLFVLTHITKFRWQPEMSTLIPVSDREKRVGSGLDGAPLVLGISTLLKQLHSAHTHSFLNFLGQFVRTHVSAATPTTGKGAALPPDVVKVLLFLEEFCKFSMLSRRTVDAVVPSYIFDCFQRV
jgi:WASH complex subunit strumpellin